jgi:hypothetical protein
MQFCSAAASGSSGRHNETKSPPGPNLHNGSPWNILRTVSFFLSGINFILALTFDKKVSNIQ